MWSLNGLIKRKQTENSILLKADSRNGATNLWVNSNRGERQSGFNGSRQNRQKAAMKKQLEPVRSLSQQRTSILTQPSGMKTAPITMLPVQNCINRKLCIFRGQWQEMRNSFCIKLPGETNTLYADTTTRYYMVFLASYQLPSNVELCFRERKNWLGTTSIILLNGIQFRMLRSAGVELTDDHSTWLQ